MTGGGHPSATAGEGTRDAGLRWAGAGAVGCGARRRAAGLQAGLKSARGPKLRCGEKVKRKGF
jgi:hypothetical protein